MEEQTPARTRNDRGHANNVAHFDEMLMRIPLYGAIYNPKNTALQIAQLTLRAQQGRSVLEEVDAAMAVYKTAIDARKDMFDTLSAKVSGSLAALNVSGASEAVCETAAQLARKITGGGGDKPEAAPLAPGETPAPTRSTSQMGFDNRAANFAAYVTLLNSIGEYDPNEAWLKPAALKQFSDDLFDVNQNAPAATAFYTPKKTISSKPGRRSRSTLNRCSARVRPNTAN